MSWSTSEIRVRLVPSNMFRPFSHFLTDRSKVMLLLLINFVICVSCHSMQPCGHLLGKRPERAYLLALLCVMFSCVFVTFPYGALGQVWYLIVSIPDICLLPYFNYNAQAFTLNSTRATRDLSIAYTKTCQAVWKSMKAFRWEERGSISKKL